MARLFFLTLAALAASCVFAQTLLDCGESQYNPADYTCFDGDFLCPILDPQGFNDVDVLLRCGDACYSTNHYTCNGTTLETVPIGSNLLEQCGDARFYTQDYVCINESFLCPIVDHVGYLRCGDACYSPFDYKCTDNALVPLPPKGCVSQGGQDVWCNNEGCFILQCCEGLFSIADKCRSPCEFGEC
ncbi:unnamed protein product [Mycena citricolor]|uniref:Endo-1,3(4)-beta-glucanase 1 carbohydrate binding domain-containing protein n=1 Tax=Mycena citricolor TaxID=2018698 RepID=A0AAD2H8F8_9AGAR|nr:unnamed protein product [Mycena citricolor]